MAHSRPVGHCIEAATVLSKEGVECEVSGVWVTFSLKWGGKVASSCSGSAELQCINFKGVKAPASINSLCLSPF